MLQTYIALGIGIALLLIGIIAYLGMDRDAGFGALLIFGFLGFCVLGIAWMGWADAKATLDGSLYLYEQGLVYIDKRVQVAWYWHEIAKVFYSVTVHPRTRFVRYLYQLEHQDGSTISFYDFLRDPAGAFQEICDRVYPQLLSNLVEKFQTNETLEFGLISLNRSEIQVGKKRIPWSEVAGASVSGGSLFIERRSGLIKNREVNLGTVPNVRLLLHLIEQQLNREGG